MRLSLLKSKFGWLAASLVLGLSSCSDSDPYDPSQDAPEPPLPDHTPAEVQLKPKAMWIDTEANYYKLSKKANIDAELEKVKKYGMNLVYVDAKSSNGYALYKSDMLPYCNTFKNLTVERDYDDYLGYIVDKCDELDIDVVASVCAMGWGWHKDGQTQGYIYDHWDQWKDKVQVRSDENNPDITIPISEDPLQEFVLLDPMYPEVQDLVVKACVELVTKYPKLKGISLDYLRYNNNDGGWFGLGDDNMKGYAEYWGEPVPNHLEMVTATGGVGPKFAKWIEFRSAMVTNLLAKIRTAVKAVNPDCEIHLWASAQWSSRYAVGQNWASKKFKPTGMAYTDTYSRTGFADLLDVFITGAYASNVWKTDDPTSEWTVENFVTSWNNYIMGDCKCYCSIAAYALNSKQHSDATYLCLQHTDGYMTFELSHVNNGNLWTSIIEGISRYERNYNQ